MTLRRGFKKEAHDYAREFRSDLSLELHDPLCPWVLAKHLCIPMVPLSSYRGKIPLHVHHLQVTDPKSFSAITVFCGKRRLIIHNDQHHKHRQRANISHELSHAILGHPSTAPFDEIGCRNFDTEIEEEANYLGPALLVSEEAALYIVKNRMNIKAASKHYEVSEQIIQMRLNLTGAKKRVGINA